MLDFITIALGFILIALVAGNNLSVCFGGVIASRVISRRTGVLLTVLGYTSGLLLQSGFLSNTITLLLPSSSMLVIDVALVISIAIFIVSQLKSVPQSLSITITAVLVGVDIAMGVAINLDFIAYIAIFWILMPIICFAFVMALMKALRRDTIKRNIWTYVSAVKLLLIVSSFFVSFTLGGNTIGLVYNLMPSGSYTTIIIIIAIIFGSVAFNAGPLRKVGNEIIPISCFFDLLKIKRSHTYTKFLNSCNQLNGNKS